MPSEKTSSHDRRKYVNAERATAALELDLGGAQKRETIPFVFAVLSNLHGERCSQKEQLAREQMKEKTPEEFFKLHAVCQRSDFTALFQKLKPQFYKTVKNRLVEGDPDLAVELDIRSMADFGPEQIAASVPAIRERLRFRNAVQRIRDRVAAKAEAHKLLSEGMTDEGLLKEIKES